MTGDLTLFRRAGVNSTLGRVEVEIKAGEVYTLPGSYIPERVLARVLATRAVDLSKWERL